MNYQWWLAKPIRTLIIAGLFFFIFSGENNVSAEKKEIDINTSPNSYLFKVGNLKPGDWMPRDIKIKNEGKKDFKYIAKIGTSKSVKGLFEELQLIVKKDTKTLYEGKLKEFEGFTPRELAKGSEETLFFQVTMPFELGNEFQGSSAEVEIIFLAEGVNQTGTVNDNETTLPGDSNNPGEGTNDSPSSTDADTNVSPKMVNKLPNTATDMFNLIFAGAFLVLGGGIYYLIKKRKLVDVEK